jgi:methanogenic corrinoid protein MtbC1
MRRDVLMEQFFTALISGDRTAARLVVDQMLETEASAEQILAELFWPVITQIQKLHRHDQMSDLAFHYATRLMRSMVDQMQMRLQMKDRRGKTAMVICGPEESEELTAQMAADLLEADGYDVHFVGGGVANDEIVAEVGEIDADILVVFGVVPSTVPFTRLLIDRLHEIGVCPKLQIAVGGGVFNRADGLAEEIGADLWAATPHEMVTVLAENPDRRMADDQRTVGRKRRTKGVAAA